MCDVKLIRQFIFYLYSALQLLTTVAGTEVGMNERFLDMAFITPMNKVYLH